MDTREWDRIADLLMQIRLKYMKLDSEDALASKHIRYCRHYLDQLILLNDNLAEADVRGMI